MKTALVCGTLLFTALCLLGVLTGLARDSTEPLDTSIYIGEFTVTSETANVTLKDVRIDTARTSLDTFFLGCWAADSDY
jgi:hypothetical protein